MIASTLGLFTYPNSIVPVSGSYMFSSLVRLLTKPFVVRFDDEQFTKYFQIN